MRVREGEREEDNVWLVAWRSGCRYVYVLFVYRLFLYFSLYSASIRRLTDPNLTTVPPFLYPSARPEPPKRKSQRGCMRGLSSSSRTDRRVAAKAALSLRDMYLDRRELQFALTPESEDRVGAPVRGEGVKDANRVEACRHPCTSFKRGDAFRWPLL